MNTCGGHQRLKPCRRAFEPLPPLKFGKELQGNHHIHQPVKRLAA
jgi:hypothetical protein